jgi:dihydropyrimidinase
MLDLVIRGGLVVTPAGADRLDVGIADGTFAALSRPGELTGRRIVDATGMVVLPGGVDPHVHIATQSGGVITLDDFRTATIPAAVGGTTTVVEFAIPRKGESSGDAVARRHREAAGTSLIDYAFHAVVTSERFEESLSELPQLRSKGVFTVKVFSAYQATIGLPMGRIHTVLTECARYDLLPLVHCETESLIQEGIQRQVAAGDLSARAHASSRSPLAEADAIRSVCAMAEDSGAPVYIVHISTGVGAAVVAECQARGQRVIGETCPQYLFLDASVYSRPNGELWICSPPIRPKPISDELWEAIESGVLGIVSTDHNCFNRIQKAVGHNDFRQAPNGLPGVEFRMPLLIDAALGGRMDWLSVARLCAEAPARAMRLSPRKGAIAIGADADCILVDPNGTTDLAYGHMATDYSPFEGITVRGGIRSTWLRGDCLVRDGELVATSAAGHYLPVPVSEAK